MRARTWRYRWPLAAVLLFLLFCLAVPAFSASNRLAGDEPDYLLTAHSLVTDGDLDLADEYSDRAHAPYHPGELVAQDAARVDGTRLSPHGIGLPLLLAPGYAVAGWVGARLTLALVAAVVLVAAGILAERHLGPLPGRAAKAAPLAAVAFCALSAPLWVYSTQVYPELPAAALVVAAALLWSGRTRVRRPSAVAVALAAVVGGLLLLGIKYLPVAAAVTAVSLVRLRHDRRALAVLSVTTISAAAVVVAWTVVVYGGPTPYSTNRLYAGTSTVAVVADTTGGWDRTYRLLGLIVDRHFGIARYGPVWLAALVALPLAAVRRRPGTGAPWWPLVTVVSVQWATATWLALTMRGWWFPGRQVVTVLPLLVPAVAWAVSVAPRVLAVLGASSAVVGAAMVRALDAGLVAAARDPFFLPLPGFGAAGALYPSFRTVTAGTYLLACLWLALAAVLGWWLWRCSAPQPPPRDASPQPGGGLGGGLLVGFPARDEESTVAGLVARARALDVGTSVNVVVVDDGCSDATAARARAAGATVLRPPPGRHGLGAAVQAILDHGVRTGAAAVGFLDADGEYAPEDLPALLAPIRAGTADYVTGDRFRRARPAGMPMWRNVGNRAGSALVGALLGRRIRDAQSGIRVLSADAAAAVPVRHDYNYAQVLTIDLLRRGFRMQEVPVGYLRRRHGRTFVRLPTYLRRVVPAMLTARFTS